MQVVKYTSMAFLLALVEDCQSARSGTLSVLEDTVILGLCPVFVPVGAPNATPNKVDAIIEAVAVSCTKNIVVPRCTVPVEQRRSALWALNYSPRPVVIPCGLKLAYFNEYMASSVAGLSEQADQSARPFPDDLQFLHMINESALV